MGAPSGLTNLTCKMGLKLGNWVSGLGNLRASVLGRAEGWRETRGASWLLGGEAEAVRPEAPCQQACAPPLSLLGGRCRAGCVERTPCLRVT